MDLNLAILSTKPQIISRWRSYSLFRAKEYQMNQDIKATKALAFEFFISNKLPVNYIYLDHFVFVLGRFFGRRALLNLFATEK